MIFYLVYLVQLYSVNKKDLIVGIISSVLYIVILNMQYEL